MRIMLTNSSVFHTETSAGKKYDEFEKKEQNFVNGKRYKSARSEADATQEQLATKSDQKERHIAY